MCRGKPEICIKLCKWFFCFPALTLKMKNFIYSASLAIKSNQIEVIDWRKRWERSYPWNVGLLEHTFAQNYLALCSSFCQFYKVLNQKYQNRILSNVSYIWANNLRLLLELRRLSLLTTSDLERLERERRKFGPEHKCSEVGKLTANAFCAEHCLYTSYIRSLLLNTRPILHLPPVNDFEIESSCYYWM